MDTNLTATERKTLAEQLKLNEQYLYQCLTGRRDMKPGEARRVETESGGRLRRQDLCQGSWREIWPELITAAEEGSAATQGG